MLTRDEADRIKTNLRRVMAGTIELGDLIIAIDRETELEPFLQSPSVARAPTRDFEFESVTQPIPLETSKELVDRLRRTTKELES